eukprot:Filipodium_phascolosomae@DN1021_c0_g1_i2.p2
MEITGYPSKLPPCTCDQINGLATLRELLKKNLEETLFESLNGQFLVKIENSVHAITNVPDTFELMAISRGYCIHLIFQALLTMPQLDAKRKCTIHYISAYVCSPDNFNRVFQA